MFNLAVIFDPIGYRILSRVMPAIPSVMGSELGEFATEGIFPFTVLGGVRLRLQIKMFKNNIPFFKGLFFDVKNLYSLV